LDVAVGTVRLVVAVGIVRVEVVVAIAVVVVVVVVDYFPYYLRDSVSDGMDMVAIENVDAKL
jgi:hypothetical protein